MEEKIWLAEGFCPTDGYHCLMPVAYQAVPEPGGTVREYRKDRIVCRHALQGNCEKEAECHFFAQAPEILDKNAPWHEN